MISVFNNTSIIKRLIKADMIDYTVCSSQEATEFLQQKAQGESLPDDVIMIDDKAYRIDPEEFTLENEKHLVSVAQILYLKSINGWLKFFGIMAIIGLIGGLITAIVALAS